jgi:hypothetical protein
MSRCRRSTYSVSQPRKIALVSAHRAPTPFLLKPSPSDVPESTPPARAFSTSSPFGTSTDYSFPGGTSAPHSSGGGKKKTNVGAIAGGVVGGLVAIGLIVGGLLLSLMRRRRAAHAVSVPPAQDATPEMKPAMYTDYNSYPSSPPPQKPYVSPVSPLDGLY